jgi:hypothetical protein
VLYRPATIFANSAGDVTINPGCTYDIGNQMYLERGATVANDGTLNANGPSARFVWFQAGGNGTYQGAGTSTGVLSSWETGMANLMMSSPLNVRRAVIFTGNILNSSQLALGDGSSTLNVVQIGNTTTPTAAGAFDVPPTFNLGTGGEHLAYLRTTAPRTTGVEVEPSRAPVNLTYDDNDGSHALTIAGGDLTVSGTAALTNGRVITNANRLIANGAVTRTTGYVDGLLQKPVTVGGPVARTFEVGDAVAYSPVNVTFASVSGAGTLTGKATGGDHPQIGSSDIIPAKSVNRYWTLTNSGTTFTTASAVFNFVPGDIDAGANFNSFFVRKYDAPNWSSPATGTRTATSTQATGITSFSDFAVGEPPNHTILASAGPGGSISPSGSVPVLVGDDQAFTITPDANFMITDVVVDGVSQGALSSYTFTAVQADHTISATFDAATATVVVQFQAEPVGEALALRWQLSRTVALASVSLERGDKEVGPWTKVDAQPTQDGSATVVTDRSVVGGHTYWYRLVTVTTSGEQATFGPLKATAAVDVKEFSLDTVAPNPSRGALGINFAVAKPTRVHLSLLDVQGREVVVFADGDYAVGRYQAQFDGQGRSGRIPSGVYFVRYVANQRTFTKPVVFTR